MYEYREGCTENWMVCLSGRLGGGGGGAVRSNLNAWVRHFLLSWQDVTRAPRHRSVARVRAISNIQSRARCSVSQRGLRRAGDASSLRSSSLRVRGASVALNTEAAPGAALSSRTFTNARQMTGYSEQEPSDPARWWWDNGFVFLFSFVLFFIPERSAVCFTRSQLFVP